MLASQPSPQPASTRLPVLSASDMKRQGWRGVLSSMRREGHLVITNHNIPEAVILPPEQYDRLIRLATVVTPDPRLEALRLQFQERLRALDSEEAEQKLSTLMSQPMKLDGTVLAGESY